MLDPLICLVCLVYSQVIGKHWKLSKAKSHDWEHQKGQRNWKSHLVFLKSFQVYIYICATETLLVEFCWVHGDREMYILVAHGPTRLFLFSGDNAIISHCDRRLSQEHILLNLQVFHLAVIIKLITWYISSTWKSLYFCSESRPYLSNYEISCIILEWYQTTGIYVKKIYNSIRTGACLPRLLKRWSDCRTIHT